MAYRRFVLKLSGEALGPGWKSGAAAAMERTDRLGLDMENAKLIAREIAAVHARKAEIAVVVGGGNFIRGRTLRQAGVDANTADKMGMVATVINALALGVALRENGVDARVMSAISMPGIAEAYDREVCLRHLEAGRVVVLAAGTGNPHFTTDSGAALRARELEAKAVLKATNVDGVYSDDPRKNAKAKRFEKLGFGEVVRRNLQVMDITAVTLCREGGIPIVVFDLAVKGNLMRAAQGKAVGTLVKGE
ncbi:MAG TPA: UMP kinase [Candidatus Brocadiia bacterium]|nr:UMP kinase [Candidatus Brocadiia bacterium]